MRSELNETLRRELRVAFSTRAQPVWFRLAKWTIFLGVSRRLSGTSWFTRSTIGAAATAVGLHLLYRQKTEGWTRAWGGWDDVATAQRGR